MTGNPRDFTGDLSGRQHKVGGPEMSAGATWHVRVFSGLLVLRERNSSLGLDGRQSERAVGTRARKYHPDGLALAMLRQRPEKRVDHHHRPPYFPQRLGGEPPLRDFEDCVRGDHVDVVSKHGRSILHLRDGHGCGFGENLRQHAPVSLV
jgi:hypothetical protein